MAWGHTAMDRPTGQRWAHSFHSPLADPRPLMDIFVELFLALTQEELHLRCEPLDPGFLSRLDWTISA